LLELRDQLLRQMNGLAKEPPRKWPVQPATWAIRTDNFDRDSP